MKLYYSTASPYARTTQVVLREIASKNGELSQQATELAMHPFDNDAEFLQANPLGKVPCLVLDDGLSLFDSEVICQFLDQEFNNSEFWQPIADSWLLRRIYSEISGLLDLAVALRQEKMRDADNLRSEFWWQRFETGLARGIESLSSNINRVPDTVNLINLNLVCLLDYLSFRHPELELSSASLDNRYRMFASRESLRSTVPN